MFGDFILKKMLKSHGVSEEQAGQVMNIVKQNPALFKQIAEEIQEKVKSGQDQQAAAMEVMLTHQAELEKLKQS
ncbi:MAG: hypothetical protein AAB364_01785 [Patescibacteria group bacterium]